jgi:hypothetical protein
MNPTQEQIALENALNSYNLKGFKIVSLRKNKYTLLDDKGNSITGYWSYDNLNHFIMGYGKAKDKGLVSEDKALEQRFKCLYLLCLRLGILDGKLEEVGDQIDANNPKAYDAMDYYEQKIIEILGN